MDYKPPNGDPQILRMVLDYIWAPVSVGLGYCMKEIYKIKENFYITDNKNLQLYVSREEYKEDRRQIHEDMRNLAVSIKELSQAENDKFNRIMDRLDNKEDK